MSIARDIYCFAVLLTMLLAAVFSVATGVGGCWWTISARAILIEFAFRKFSNNPPSSDSVANSITFLMMLHVECSMWTCLLLEIFIALPFC